MLEREYDDNLHTIEPMKHAINTIHTKRMKPQNQILQYNCSTLISNSV